jgi:hypothetical protein
MTPAKMQVYDDIKAARAACSGRVIVWYPFQLGGAISDRYWCAEQDGQVLDYNAKHALVFEYPDAIVLTLHRSGRVSARFL